MFSREPEADANPAQVLTGTVSRAAFAGYGHDVTEAARKEWLEVMNARAQHAFRRGQGLVAQGRPADGLFWLGRAERLARTIPNVSFAYAAAALSCGRFEDCLTRVRDLNRRYGMREAAFMEAACLMRLGQAVAAADVMGRALATNHAGREMAPLIRDLARLSGKGGWCTLSNTGQLNIEADGPLTIRLDGVVIARGVAGLYDLPEGWRRAERLDVRLGRKHVLGSPVDIRALTRCQSLVLADPEGLSGWLWHPGEPEYVPWLHVDTLAPMRVEALSDIVDSDAPLARPRAFHIPAEMFLNPEAEIMLRDGNGRPLSGAPIRPVVGRLLAGDMRALPDDLRPVPVGAGPVRAAHPRSPRDCGIVIPVYRDRALTMACLQSVLASVPPDVPIVVIEDATPEQELEKALDALAAEGRIQLLRNDVNMGFPASANRGMRVLDGRDIVLLNSDTLVPQGWLERLCGWLATSDVGTVTPFSNDASILSYPSLTTGNASPTQAGVRVMDRVCQAVSDRVPVDLPTANGFCMAISAECLAEVGLFREDLFAQGYGEENDFCLRASAKGFRHLAATDVYVGHVGGASFGVSRSGLLSRNLQVLNALHPGYDRLVAAFIQRDPLLPQRRLMDMRRVRALRLRQSVVMIQHDAGGGVGRVVRDRAARLAEAGIGAFKLRPTARGCAVELADGDARYPNLRFDLPDEMDALVAFLKMIHVTHLEWHHLVGHAPWIRDLHRRLEIPYDIFVHDHVWFCPRISLLDGQGRYCGEPNLSGCERCVARWGSYLDEEISLPDLVQRSEQEFLAARRMIAPSHDTARRMMRHFPQIDISVEPLEDEAALAAIPPGRRRVRRDASVRVCILGGISRWKGYDVLLALAREIRARGLPITLILIGHTPDDDLLLSLGVIVTGEYRENEVQGLIAAQNVDIGFVPSVAPETWCYTLGQLRRAGLPVLCFDLGAQAERVRGWPNGGMIIPLGLPVPMLADLIFRNWGA